MILEGRNISFKFGDEVLFDNFSFQLNSGEKLVLKGESGSGKSTFFKLILGFEIPDSGEFLYRGSILDNKGLRSFRKETAWLPQDLNLGTGTVEEVFMTPFQFKSSSNKPSQDVIHEQLQVIGLDVSIMEKNFSDLSTGQRQRVGLLICKLMDKNLTLLDEPTSALDRDSKEKLADMMLNSERTIISTSHDPFWVERCDRVIEMS